jgi:hypothetical protein
MPDPLAAAGILHHVRAARAIPLSWTKFGTRLPWGSLEKLGELVRRQRFLEALREWGVATALREAEVPDTLKRYFDELYEDTARRRVVCEKALGQLFGTFADEYSLGAGQENTELVALALEDELEELPAEVRDRVAEHLGKQLSKLQPHSIDRAARTLVKEVCG